MSRGAPQDAAAPRWLYPVLALLTAIGAAARLAHDPWIAHQAPAYARLLEGQLIMRDTADFHGIVPFVAGATPFAGGHIGMEHYRAWLPVYGAGVVYFWTRDLYWSMALIDLVSVWLGAVCMYRLARRLGVSSAGSAIAAVLTAASPVYASVIWMQQIHGANTASLVWGSYAALLVLDGEFDSGRAVWRSTAAMGLALFGTSLLYNYVWVVVPCLFAVVAVEGTRRRARLLILLLGVLGYAGLTIATRRALTLAGWPLFPQDSDPERRVLRLLQGAGESGALVAVVKGMDPRHMASVFHPLPLLVGIAGMCLGTARLRVAGALSTVLAAYQGALADVPWAVINNYPFVYAGTGVAIVSIASLARQARPRAGLWAACALTALLVAVANVDVVGDYSLVRGAWIWLHAPI